MSKVLALALLCLLAACGGGGDEEPKAEDPRPPMCQQRPEICK